MVLKEVSIGSQMLGSEKVSIVKNDYHFIKLHALISRSVMVCIQPGL